MGDTARLLPLKKKKVKTNVAIHTFNPITWGGEQRQMGLSEFRPDTSL